MKNPEIKAEIKKHLDTIASSNIIYQNRRQSLLPTFDAIKALHTPDFEKNFKSAVGKIKKYQEASMYVFAELPDLFSKDFIKYEILESYHESCRSMILQRIGNSKLSGLLFVLHEVMENYPDDVAWAITSLGEIADDSSIPLLIDLYKKTGTQYSGLAMALRKFRPNPSVIEPLKHIFVLCDEYPPTHKDIIKRDKIMAAWALCKHGCFDHYDYIVGLLEDSDISTETSFSPGEARTAAQAISDIKGWEFEWEEKYVQVVKDRLKVEQ
jgi:hypothetical protein